jgi:SecD/SecF fusion protein
VASGTYTSVFIAGPVLVHWKEREPVYRARQQRILAEFGEIPAYAVATAGAPVDVAPKQRRRGVVATADPTQGVGQEEFEELVANLGVEQESKVAPPRAQQQRPKGGRRARLGNAPPTQPPESGTGEGEPKPKKPRNTKHGRPR